MSKRLQVGLVLLFLQLIPIFVVFLQFNINNNALHEKRSNGNVSSHVNKLMVSIIVSHCKENLDWLESLLSSICDSRQVKVFLYEKCARKSNIKVFGGCTLKTFPLPNVGREGHTWIHHMFHEHQQFSDLNLFLQGGLEANIQTVRNEIFSVNKTRVQVIRTSVYYKSLLYNWCTFNTYRFSKFWHYSTFCYWLEKLTGTKKECENLVSSYRGEFAVNKIALKKVVKNHRVALLRLYDILGENNDPDLGQYLERLWFTIFEGPHYERSCSSFLRNSFITDAFQILAYFVFPSKVTAKLAIVFENILAW